MVGDELENNGCEKEGERMRGNINGMHIIIRRRRRRRGDEEDTRSSGEDLLDAAHDLAGIFFRIVR